MGKNKKKVLDGGNKNKNTEKGEKLGENDQKEKDADKESLMVEKKDQNQKQNPSHLPEIPNLQSYHQSSYTSMFGYPGYPHYFMPYPMPNMYYPGGYGNYGMPPPLPPAAENILPQQPSTSAGTIEIMPKRKVSLPPNHTMRRRNFVDKQSDPLKKTDDDINPPALPLPQDKNMPSKLMYNNNSTAAATSTVTSSENRPPSPNQMRSQTYYNNNSQQSGRQTFPKHKNNKWKIDKVTQDYIDNIKRERQSLREEKKRLQNLVPQKDYYIQVLEEQVKTSQEKIFNYERNYYNQQSDEYTHAYEDGAYGDENYKSYY